MKVFKILSLSTCVFLANCSLIDDKFFSKSKDKPEENNEQQEIVTERVYEDKKAIVKDLEKPSNEDFLAGDIQEEEDYPNLANVPQRPDESVSIEEQKKIIKDLKEENIENLDSIKSFPIEEKILSESEVTKFNEIDEENKLKNNLERTKSIRDIQNQKLVEYKSYKPKSSNNKPYVRDEEEEDLHKLAESLKNIKSEDEVIKLEEKIQKKDLNYSPTEIANILGVRGLDDSSMDSLKTHELKTKKHSEKQVANEQVANEKVANNNETKDLSSKNHFKRDVPIASISFPHGSSKLTNTDLEKIKNIIKTFNENNGRKLIIVGHSSSRTVYDMELTKHALVNFNMSLERATVVMNQFSTIGLESEKMEMIAMSDAEPIYPEIMPSLEAANRRAEIFIQY